MSINKKIIEVEATVPPPPPPDEATGTPTGKSNFNIALYTGNNNLGGQTQTINVGFRPDIVWLKGVESTNAHHMYDSNRGMGKPIYPSEANAEVAGANHVDTTSTGFTLKTDNMNYINIKYVAWCWKVGNGPSSNSNGSINAQVQVNSSIECSVITYTGNGSTSATVGHGLSGTPDFVVVKDRQAAGAWNAIHTNIPANTGYVWHGNAAASSSMGNNGGITRNQLTSTTFGFQSGNIGVDSVNTNGRNYLAFAFKSKSGNSHFGGYTGTGSSGKQITGLGFKPDLLILKRYDSSGNWIMIDSQRDTTDIRTAALFLDTTSAQSTSEEYGVNFDSGGFTITGTNNSVNASGGSYTYLAFRIH